MEEEWRGWDSPVPGHRTGPASVYMYNVHCMSTFTHTMYVYMYSRHQKKLPVLQNGTDSFVVENGKRTDTKRI